MHIETDGLVIKEQSTGESDRLITILTSKYGLVRAFANGGKTIKNKNLAGTQLLAYSDFVLYQGKDAYNVNEAKEKEVFFDLRSNIDNLSLAFYLAELFGELAPEAAECEELLKLLLNCLFLLSKEKLPSAQVKSIAELRALALSGYAPSLIACEECGTFESDIMYFDIKRGTLRCNVCGAQGFSAMPLSISSVTAMRHIVFSEPKKVFDFTLTDKALLELSAVTEAYVKEHVDKHFKTLDFLKSLQGI